HPNYHRLTPAPPGYGGQSAKPSSPSCSPSPPHDQAPVPQSHAVAAPFSPSDIVSLLEGTVREQDAREVVRRILALIEETVRPRIATIGVHVADLNALSIGPCHAPAQPAQRRHGA